MKLVSPLPIHLIHFDLSPFEGVNAYWSPTAQMFAEVAGMTVRLSSCRSHLISYTIPLRLFNCHCGETVKTSVQFPAYRDIQIRNVSRICYGVPFFYYRRCVHHEEQLLYHSNNIAADKRGLYRFAVDLGKLALDIADRHGSNGNKWYCHL
jgi:hypothetical protein